MKSVCGYKFLILFLALSPFAQAKDLSDTLQLRVEKTSETIEAFTGEDAAKDLQIPRELFQKAVCVVIIPSYKRAGFVFGGSYGRGVASCRNQNSQFDNPFFVSLMGGSYGFQIGGQSADIVLVMSNQDAPAQFQNAKGIKLGVEAAIAFGPIGRDAQADTNLFLQDKILSYSRSRGIYAGLVLNGAKLSRDHNADSKALEDIEVANNLQQLTIQLNAVK
jgi:lipid-binding SYLF domain-containing protein